MKSCKSILLMITGILLSQSSFAQIREVMFEQLDSFQTVEKRPVVVFLHTSWCKYCGSMKNATLKNKDVVQLINDKFYFISFDIEEKSDINFRGNTFRYKPTGPGAGIHELAEQLGTINEAIAYPGISFLNPDLEIIYQKEGYLNTKELMHLLKSL